MNDLFESENNAKENIYSEIRYNSNTSGSHLSIRHGNENSLKTSCGVASLLSLLVSLGEYKKSENIESSVDEMIEKAKEDTTGSSMVR